MPFFVPSTTAVQKSGHRSTCYTTSLSVAIQDQLRGILRSCLHRKRTEATVYGTTPDPPAAAGDGVALRGAKQSLAM